MPKIIVKVNDEVENKKFELVYPDGEINLKFLMYHITFKIKLWKYTEICFKEDSINEPKVIFKGNKNELATDKVVFLDKDKQYLFTFKKDETRKD